MPRMSDPQRVYEFLDAMGVQYDKYEHPPVFTGEEAAQHWGPIEATQVKNLFLRNKKGDRQYLVILRIDKQADLRQLVKIIGDDRFSFGSPERLMSTLGVTPGSVSPFGLLHEGSQHVRVIVRAQTDFSSESEHRQRHHFGCRLRALPRDTAEHRAMDEVVERRADPCGKFFYMTAAGSRRSGRN
jgi:Ala-tRNA(Pro) deacylase